MFSALGRNGRRIQRHMSPASTRGPWTMKFIFSQLHLSTVSFVKGSHMCMCVCFLEHEDFNVVWHWAYPALCRWTSSQPYWQRSHSEASDITLFILLLFPLCLSAPIPTPSPPSCPIHFLLSPLISLTHIRRGKCQCNVALLMATLDWINTWTGYAGSTLLTWLTSS